MLMPSIFGENFMDDFFGVPERTYTQSAQNALMKTDVVENKDGFDVSIDLPGFKKEDVKGEVKDGYLIITASTKQNKEEKNKDGKYIRKERYLSLIHIYRRTGTATGTSGRSKSIR